MDAGKELGQRVEQLAQGASGAGTQGWKRIQTGRKVENATFVNGQNDRLFRSFVAAAWPWQAARKLRALFYANRPAGAVTTLPSCCGCWDAWRSMEDRLHQVSPEQRFQVMFNQGRTTTECLFPSHQSSAAKSRCGTQRVRI